MTAQIAANATKVTEAPVVSEDLINLLHECIDCVENDCFRPVLYRALGALHEFTGCRAGVSHVKSAPPAVDCTARPSFQRAEEQREESNDDLLASGWLEQMIAVKTPENEGRVHSKIIWKPVLALLTQKSDDDEPCLWITDESGAALELETLHCIPMRQLIVSEYINFYGDYRFRLKLKRRDHCLIFRCKDSSSAKKWVSELKIAKQLSTAGLTSPRHNPDVDDEEPIADVNVELEFDAVTGDIVNINEDIINEREEYNTIKHFTFGGSNDTEDDECIRSSTNVGIDANPNSSSSEIPTSSAAPAAAAVSSPTGKKSMAIADRLQEAEDLRRIRIEQQKQEEQQRQQEEQQRQQEEQQRQQEEKQKQEEEQQEREQSAKVEESRQQEKQKQTKKLEINTSLPGNEVVNIDKNIEDSDVFLQNANNILFGTDNELEQKQEPKQVTPKQEEELKLHAAYLLQQQQQKKVKEQQMNKKQPKNQESPRQIDNETKNAYLKAAEEQKRKGFELEQRKKLANEKRRQELIEQRRKAQEEQKKKELEERRKFLEKEQRKEELKAKAKLKSAAVSYPSGTQNNLTTSSAIRSPNHSEAANLMNKLNNSSVEGINSASAVENETGNLDDINDARKRIATRAREQLVSGDEPRGAGLSTTPKSLSSPGNHASNNMYRSPVGAVQQGNHFSPQQQQQTPAQGAATYNWRHDTTSSAQQMQQPHGQWRHQNAMPTTEVPCMPQPRVQYATNATNNQHFHAATGAHQSPLHQHQHSGKYHQPHHQQAHVMQSSHQTMSNSQPKQQMQQQLHSNYQPTSTSASPLQHPQRPVVSPSAAASQNPSSATPHTQQHAGTTSGSGTSPSVSTATFRASPSSASSPKHMTPDHESTSGVSSGKKSATPKKQQAEIMKNENGLPLSPRKKATTTEIKHEILVKWALQPPNMQLLRSLDDLLCNIHMVYPASSYMRGVEDHPYFKNWNIINKSDLIGATNLLDEGKIKKAVRKTRVFLHPDKLPGDFNDEQLFVCKLLWDIVNDAFEEYKKKLSN